MPVRSWTTSSGQERRLIRSAISSATLPQPPYLRAGTMEDAGSIGYGSDSLIASRSGSLPNQR